MTTPAPRSPSPLRSPGFLLSAAFLLVVLVGAGVLVVAGQDDPAGGADAPPSAAPPRAAAAGDCRPTDTNQNLPAAAPADVTWKLTKTVALPYSASAGPFVVDADVARCYAHTPVGALVAAPQIYWRAGAAAGWKRVMTHQLTGTPAARAAFVSLCEGRCGGTIPANTYGQYIAYKFLSYSQATAVIELVTRLPSGRMNVLALTLAWEGDWKLQLQPNGLSGPEARAITSLDGYVPWGGA